MKKRTPPETLSQAMSRLRGEGFRRELRAHEGQLEDDDGERFDPESLQVAEVVRFEGESDPGDEAILFALRHPERGFGGLYAVSYGPQLAPDDAELVRRLDARAGRRDAPHGKIR